MNVLPWPDGTLPVLLLWFFGVCACVLMGHCVSSHISLHEALASNRHSVSQVIVYH